MESQMASKIRFITIGYIERRKGQDILIEAIGHLPEMVAGRAEFFLVGQDTSVMAQELKRKMEGMSNVRMCGTVSREEVHRLLDVSDMMICPSREDPMPTVCAEAMMHHVPCLMSDSVGTCAYIRDGYDGVIFRCGDSMELSEKIRWCIEHREELSEMGERAFRIYESVFSEQVFEENLLRYVREMIGKAGKQNV